MTTTALINCPQGTTRLYAVLGFPVAQVMAPRLMNPIFRDAGADAVMVPVHVSPENLASVVECLKLIGNLEGMLVTIPHKFAVTDHADHFSEAVSITGAANALRRDADGRWSAENFDGQGFVAGLHKAGHETLGKTVAMVGTGGAGIAIAAALLASGVSSLVVTDIVQEKAEHLVQRLSAFKSGIVQFKKQIDWFGIDIAINATPMGLQASDPLPFDVALLDQTTLVAEVIMKPAETPLLAAAALRGLRIHHGLNMLTSQIELYRRFFGIAEAAAAA